MFIVMVYQILVNSMKFVSKINLSNFEKGLFFGSVAVKLGGIADLE